MSGVLHPFFRRIKISMALFIAVLLVLTAVIPAPLQEPANISRVPNPVKSAWFLLWIQELVSYSKYLIYAVLGFAGCFFLLPWLSGTARTGRAAWFQKEQVAVSIITILAIIIMIALTVIAMFFRGKNWELSVPF